MSDSEFPETMPARFRAGTFKVIDKVRKPFESRAALIREAVDDKVAERRQK